MNGRESAVIGTGPVTRGTGENWGGAVCANAVLPTSKTSKARRQVRIDPEKSSAPERLPVISHRHSPVPGGAEARAVVEPRHMHEIVVDGDADELATQIAHAATARHAR